MLFALQTPVHLRVAPPPIFLCVIIKETEPVICMEQVILIFIRQRKMQVINWRHEKVFTGAQEHVFIQKLPAFGVGEHIIKIMNRFGRRDPGDQILKADACADLPLCPGKEIFREIRDPLALSHAEPDYL